MKKIRQNILKTLAYFDIFNYPLTNEEVRRFLPQKCNQLVVNEILYQLIRENEIYKLRSFYSLQNQPELAEIRIAGNQRAIKLLKIARIAAKILSWFPFVQSVAVSGSLSKNFADEKADIDFFIITSANRLWIARTCMHIFKKLTFLAGKQNWFCMNYYIDEMKMEIVEKIFSLQWKLLRSCRCRESIVSKNLLKQIHGRAIIFGNKLFQMKKMGK